MADSRNPKGQESGSPRRSVTGDLASRIARARSTSIPVEAAGTTRRNDMSGAGRAFRLASEFVAAIVVGAGLGLGIDTIAGTKPWAMVTLLILGFGAGVLNVVRATAEINAVTPIPDQPQPAPDDDED